MLYRPVTVFRCRGGRCLAGEDAFAEMQRRKVDCLEYYNIYVDILARLSNRTPRSYHPFAAAGADAEGVRRSRGSPFGSDILRPAPLPGVVWRAGLPGERCLRALLRWKP